MFPADLIQISEAAPPADFNRDIAVRQNVAANVEEVRNGAPRICIVDDDDWVCDSLGVLLETYGYPVISYRSGTEFLADGWLDRIGCLIIDQHMAGVEGLGVIAELQRRGIVVPTILITGRLDPGIAQRAQRLGVLGVLEKPFPVGSLIKLIGLAANRTD